VKLCNKILINNKIYFIKFKKLIFLIIKKLDRSFCFIIINISFKYNLFVQESQRKEIFLKFQWSFFIYKDFDYFDQSFITFLNIYI
jgi:hypothetical protein